MRIDWATIGAEIGAEGKMADGGVIALADERVGRRALEVLLGGAAIEDAVDTAARCQAGAAVAESVLSVLRSERATEYCYRRFREETELDLRRAYASVLRSCAAGIALAWLDQLWADRDEMVQVLAAKMLERMAVAGIADEEEMRRAVEVGSRHPSLAVREQVDFARIALSGGEGACAPLDSEAPEDGCEA